MEHKIMKTAKNLINHKEGDSLLLPNGDYSHTEYINVNMVRKLMIEFAKMHVEACKKDILNNVEIDDYDVHGQYSPSVNEDSILNSYSLTNIK